MNPQTNELYSEGGKTSAVNENLGDRVSHLSGLLDLTGQNTTLAVVATNVEMNKNQLMKVAEIAQDGMARAIYPVHTNMDGDVVFAISSLSGEQKQFPKMNHISLTDIVGLGASEAMSKQ